MGNGHGWKASFSRCRRFESCRGHPSELLERRNWDRRHLSRILTPGILCHSLSLEVSHGEPVG